ncbi:KAP family P-loop NTPase fold protein [Roseovarius aestuarii]|uniref:KAP family P-loop domain protein n=1 Tax=Roseovarius aestuarii TaxID=475083 RepID=A0A1X7BWK1_9RHOB|nr:P-loop NTPase fold protein [Roseovarius aestuarii]SMC14018.1 KAP family P-loop domain protein [Roseovarius aestuarii]
MAAPSVKINNLTAFENWGKDKPDTWLNQLATRIALRGLPRVLTTFDLAESSVPLEEQKQLLLQAFRASFLIWTSAFYPNQNIGFAQKEAAEDLRKAIAKVKKHVDGKELVAGRVILIVADYVGTTDKDQLLRPALELSASLGSPARGAGEWDAIGADAEWLEGNLGNENDLSKQALWLLDVRGDSRYLTNFPLSMREPFDRFDKSKLVVNGPWYVWLKWYRGIIPNTTGDKPTSAFGERADVSIAALKRDFWNRPADDVVEELARLVESRALSEDGSVDGVGEADFDRSKSPRNAWLAQFKDGDRVAQWVSEARADTEIDWKIGNRNIDEMRPGDAVVYWRTITKGRDKGGIVGTGFINSADRILDTGGVERVKTTVVEFFDEAPVDRKEVIAQTGLNPGMWQFSLYQLPNDVAEKINSLLESHNRKGLISESISSSRPPAGEVVFVSDAPENDEDLLGRADLSFMLAARLNRIWDEMAKNPGNAGFVVHIDAPWGGGKTSFANYLVSMLNPYRFNKSLPKVLSGIHLENENFWPAKYRRPWFIVDFNAWQHQHVNPPWWCFYQAIRKQTFDAVRAKLNPDPDNSVVAKLGGRSSGWIGRHAKWLKLWMAELWWRLFQPKTRNLLGISIVTLLMAFLAIRYGLLSFDDTKNKFTWSFDSWPPLVLSAATLTLGGASAIWAFVSVISESLFPGSPASANNYSLGAGDPLERFRKHFSGFLKRLRHPIIVVVDDIDRCEPQFVVELVRGMQTILKSPRIVFLLLGDRDWIEQAFSEAHKVMQGIDVGSEHTFGGRFVEKAIQLSIILPDIPKEQRSEFVRSLLGVDYDSETSIEQLPENERKIVEDAMIKLDTTLEPSQRDRDASEVRDTIANLQSIDDELKEKVVTAIDRRTALRSAADEKVQAATRHRLEPISDLLPPNPRQIKRIINSIALFQEIARTTLRIQPDTKNWRQLVLWIILMTEWRQTFMTLATWPELVSRIHDPETQVSIAGLDNSSADEWTEAILANPDAMALLDFPSVKGAPNEWSDSRIDAAAIKRLNIIFPPTSGRTLPSSV